MEVGEAHHRLAGGKADVDDAIGGDAPLRGVVAADLDARRVGVVDDDGDVARPQADRWQHQLGAGLVALRRRRGLRDGRGDRNGAGQGCQEIRSHAAIVGCRCAHRIARQGPCLASTTAPGAGRQETLGAVE